MLRVSLWIYIHTLSLQLAISLWSYSANLVTWTELQEDAHKIALHSVLMGFLSRMRQLWTQLHSPELDKNMRFPSFQARFLQKCTRLVTPFSFLSVCVSYLGKLWIFWHRDTNFQTSDLLKTWKNVYVVTEFQGSMCLPGNVIICEEQALSS